MDLQEAYIVIDIGTGNVRVAVVSVTGTLLGLARVDMEYIRDELYPEALYFDPNKLWQEIQDLAHKALAEAGPVAVLAVTSTSQREGIVLIDQHGSSLIGLPNIDHRGREWEANIPDADAVYQLTGRFPTSLFSAMKLIGIRERRKEIWAQTAQFMSISDWATYQLSGVSHYEHSQASETLLYDVKEKQWSARLCEYFNIDASLLPELKDSGTILGTVKAAAAVAFGISADALIIVGGADTQLGVQSTQPEAGDIVIVSGTTTPIVQIGIAYTTDAQQRLWTGRHIDSNSFIVEANAGVTGLNYQRLKEIFYPNEPYAVIEKELSALDHYQCVASLGSLVADEKSPITRGGFIFDTPVSHRLSRAGFVWATLWDIACSIRENYNSLCAVVNHDVDYVWACGGGIQSPVLRQFIANLLQKKIVIRENYTQSSISGGVFICNKALNKPQPEPVTLEITFPQILPEEQQLYAEWKDTRKAFKTTFN
ncbi:FGGY-family carbohydrate kinase [Pedobacter duraquae]|uniref:Autoinducer 2 (AI-2) kinase n=1 Tax=Pedobacter duraquae TaxID=425511 RepID=A0A4R6IL98_9SPHI|nr:FGGY family carbohydrate kinase [Pedobacter duraquae]TDO22900.1 autoinducer 2 (AI-2) kinase [Pedobacter duraquae]